VSGVSRTALARPDLIAPVRLFIGDEVFEATVRRIQIVHAASHSALPTKYTVGCRLPFSARTGDALFADTVIGQLQDQCGSPDALPESTPISDSSGSWSTIGFDHLSISVVDQVGATSFVRDVIGMKVMGGGEHLTGLATGPTRQRSTALAGSSIVLASHRLRGRCPRARLCTSHRAPQSNRQRLCALGTRRARESVCLLQERSSETFMMQFPCSNRTREDSPNPNPGHSCSSSRTARGDHMASSSPTSEPPARGTLATGTLKFLA